jgi:SsrA-binding protein
MEIVNRKAKHDYTVIDTYEAGIVLQGTEIKSIRDGKANLRDSYAIIKNNEVYLLNMHIGSYEKGNIFNHEETRTRKLLLNKNEITRIKKDIEQNSLTLIPLKLYFKKNNAKILLGVCKGKKAFDKRESIKKRDIEREIRKNMKIR